MSSNQALMKADLAIADLQSNGGVLLAEQANAFIRKLIKQPTLLAVARVVEMAAPIRNINKIQFGKRILRAGTSGTALSGAAITGAFDPVAEATARAKPTTEQIVLTTHEVIAEVRIPYDVMEDNIERGSVGERTDVGGSALSGGIRDTIVELIAERAALDLEELGILGDTTSTDPYLALVTGYLKRLTTSGNVVNAGGATISKAVFKAGMKAMPDQYLRNVAAMKHMVATNNEIEYRDTLADRPTGMGDQLVEGQRPVYAYGAPVYKVPLMPLSQGIFTDPLNLIMGIQRKIMLEFDKDISARVYKIVLTARVDFQVEEALAGVVYTNIDGS